MSREQARNAAEAFAATSLETTERALLEAQNQQATLAGKVEAAQHSHSRTAQRLKEEAEANQELTAKAARDRLAERQLRAELAAAQSGRTAYHRAWTDAHAEGEAKMAELVKEN